MGITDNQYSDRLIISMMLSVKILLINCMSYTDRNNLSVKLFNGIVFGIRVERVTMPW
jgi:hypothetical protein